MDKTIYSQSNPWRAVSKNSLSLLTDLTPKGYQQTWFNFWLTIVNYKSKNYRIGPTQEQSPFPKSGIFELTKRFDNLKCGIDFRLAEREDLWVAWHRGNLCAPHSTVLGSILGAPRFLIYCIK